MTSRVEEPIRKPETAGINSHLQCMARLGVKLFDAQLVCICYVDEHGHAEILVCAGELVGRAGEGMTESVEACVSHVMGQSSPLIVGDALRDARFSDLPIVRGDPSVRSFAGQRMADATCAICIFTTLQRAYAGADLELLHDLATLVETEIHRVGVIDGQRNTGARDSIPDKGRHELALALSHDFRSTLSGIIGFAEIMGDDSLSAQQLRDFAGDLHPAALRLNQMISELLELGLLPSA